MQQLHRNGHHNGGMGWMAGAAALGFVAGMAATQAKKVAIQGVSVAAGDWFEALKADHRLVEKLFQEALATDSGDVLKRKMLLTKLAYALNKHAIEEENVVYPALRQSTQGQAAMALGEDHAEIKTFIYDLRNIDASDPRWLMRCREFELHVSEHVRQEETEIFPAFRASLSAQENTRLTKLLNWEGFKVA